MNTDQIAYACGAMVVAVFIGWLLFGKPDDFDGHDRNEHDKRNRK